MAEPFEDRFRYWLQNADANIFDVDAPHGKL
jgi:hypothetical protein